MKTCFAVVMVVIGAAGSACTSLASSDTRVVRYRESFTNIVAEFQESDTQVWFSVGDVIRTLGKCQPSDAFICVTSDLPSPYPFAIPRDASVREWTIEKRKYRVASDLDDPMPPGTTMIVVEMGNIGERLWYLYSRDRGVVAFMYQPAITSQARPIWLMLEGKKGLLSPPTG